jgi:hypothetical protein
MEAWALNAVNFAHKKGTGMNGRSRNVSGITQSLSAQEGGVTSCSLVLEEKENGVAENGQNDGQES